MLPDDPNPINPDPPPPEHPEALPPQPDHLSAMILSAYAQGIFPMADPDTGELGWYDPHERGVFPLKANALRITRSLRQALKPGRFIVTSNRAFGRVIRACAAPREGQDEGASWIDPQIIALFEHLHTQGHAHSIETWLPDERGRPGALVGGLYGLACRGVFAGESMFSRPDLGGTNASKVALVHLWHHLRARGFSILDCQFWTPHLGSLGCIEISRAAYHKHLETALALSPTWGTLGPSP